MDIEKSLYCVYGASMPKKIITPQSPESLISIATRINRSGERLADIGHAMKALKIETLDVPRYATLKQAMAWLEGFVFDAEAAYQEVVEEQTDQYRAGPDREAE